MSEHDSDEDFDHQLTLEAEEQKKKSEGQGKTRVEEDGTVMEFDAEKKAWFPKIDADFIAQYQMNYGSYTTANSTSTTETPATQSTADSQTWTPDVNDPHYAYWYHHIYSKNPNPDTAYQDYYNYYYSSYYQQNPTLTDKKDDEVSSDEKTKEKKDDAGDEKTSVDSEDAKVAEDENEAKTSSDKAYEEYYKFYQDYYASHSNDTAEQSKNQPAKKAADPYQVPDDYMQRYNEYFYGHGGEEEEEDPEKNKDSKDEEDAQTKAKKRKQNDLSWFEMDDTNNTNVYVTSLPDDVTDEEFQELMSKYGLIAYDPRTRKPKLKLYRDADGKTKGDGLCCYIKAESVDLALQILDGADVRGYKISVEKAKFEMKGSFDPKKKKKKLTNKQKRDLKEKQTKLFDWRPDKLIGERPKHEKTLVIKNLFDLHAFERDPTLAAKMKADLQAECKKYGIVNRVVVHERHPDRCASVSFASPAEADNCKEFLHNRFFKGRTVTAETWDGKTKFTVEETEEEKKARLKRWREYIGDAEAAEHGASAVGGEGKNSAETSKTLAQSTVDKQDSPGSESATNSELTPSSTTVGDTEEAMETDNSQVTPAETTTCDQPKLKPMEGESEVKPTEGEIEDKATEGESEVKPMEGESEDKPTEGESEVKPTEGESAKDGTPAKEDKVPSDSNSGQEGPGSSASDTA